MFNIPSAIIITETVIQCEVVGDDELVSLEVNEPFS